jgi:hypothetical protein
MKQRKKKQNLRTSHGFQYMQLTEVYWETTQESVNANKKMFAGNQVVVQSKCH